MSTGLQIRMQAAPAASSASTPTVLLQRKRGLIGMSNRAFGHEEERKKRLSLQRNSLNQDELSTMPSTVPPIVQEVLRSPGLPLDPATRTFMEPRFGHDFSKVRVHTDAKAAESARAVNARAYTFGHDIVFGTKRYAAGTAEGRGLLAHELSHVVQQSQRSGIQTTPAIAESEATQAASQVAVGQTSSIHTAVTGGIQRQTEDVQAQTSETKGPITDLLRAEAKEDALRIKKIFQDNIVLGPFNQHDIMSIIEKWVKKPTETGTRMTSFDFFIAALRSTTFEVGMVVKQTTSPFDQIFHRMDTEQVEQFKNWMQNRARIFKGEKPIAMVTLEEEFEPEKLKQTAVEFWEKKFKNMGEFLNSIGTPTIIQNLLGGIVGVIQGFAELLIELVEGIWSLAVALDNLQGALLYFIIGALEGGGLGFLKKIPLVGKTFDPETYKKKYDATIAFFEGAKEALKHPGQILQGIKDAASKAWDEVLDEYNKADEFNKSRIIAKGVVKVGMAVGGFIKELPSLVKGAVKVAKTIGTLVFKVTKIIAKAVRGVVRFAGKIFKGIWKVVEGTFEEGKSVLKYFFQKAGTEVFEEISAEMATQFIKCSDCKITPFAEGLEKGIGEEVPHIPPEEVPVEIPGTVRGAAIEVQHLEDLGYRKLPNGFKAIDGIEGGEERIVQEGSKTIHEYTRPKGLSVKSTEVTNPVDLQRKVKDDLKALKEFSEYQRSERGITMRVKGLSERRLDLVFEEGKVNSIGKDTRNVLAQLKKEADSMNIKFHWYVYSQGSKIEGPKYFAELAKLIEEL